MSKRSRESASLPSDSIELSANRPHGVATVTGVDDAEKSNKVIQCIEKGCSLHCRSVGRPTFSYFI